MGIIGLLVIIAVGIDIVAGIIYTIVVGVGNSVVIAVDVILVALVAAIITAVAALVVGVVIVIAGIGTVVAAAVAGRDRGRRTDENITIRYPTIRAGYSHQLTAGPLKAHCKRSRPVEESIRTGFPGKGSCPVRSCKYDFFVNICGRGVSADELAGIARSYNLD